MTTAVDVIGIEHFSSASASFIDPRLNIANIGIMATPNNPKNEPTCNEQSQKKQTYSEWTKEIYNDQYEKWMPWVEDQYLKWFGKGDNKSSYATKVGQFGSKEGINRAERNGKDKSGSKAGPAASYLDAGKERASNVGSGLAKGAESAQNVAAGSLNSVKGFLPGGK
ncbi:uncharacterized protein N7498_004110 [Penicillium cinerascens]|uniref:Uncharacterized protein n=1 Tax=Penicillium cinerascens TaxID=70096 RepID=A0A9W9T7S1_9EURO|nr:uncharacterized protein N7498_004110 [Penicillium cinerascens]KAJ5212464.1 hypothetical protein N7498_004110 [Penicillium cinerascens]